MSEHAGYSKGQLTSAIRSIQRDIPRFQKAGQYARAEGLRTVLASLKDELRTR